MGMTIISTTIYHEINKELRSAGEGRWANLYMEIQNDGKALYISVDVPENNSDADNRELLKIIRQIVEPKIPPASDYCSWLATLKRSGEIVESVFPGAIIE